MSKGFYTGCPSHRPQQLCHGSARFFHIKKLIFRALSMLQIRHQVSELSLCHRRQGFSTYRRRFMSSVSPSVVRILFRVLYAPSTFPSCTITVLAMNFRCFAMTLDLSRQSAGPHFPQTWDTALTPQHPTNTKPASSGSDCLFSVDRYICAIYQIPDISNILWYLSFFPNLLHLV